MAAGQLAWLPCPSIVVSFDPTDNVTVPCQERILLLHAFISAWL